MSGLSSKVKTGRRVARARVGRAQHRTLEILKRPPVLVFSGSKTGSSTAWNSLRRSHLRRPVYHLHRLDEDMAERAKARMAEGKRPGVSAEDLRAITLLRNRLADEDVRFSVVTLIREPVARAVSSVFQRHDHTGIDMTSPDPTPDAIDATVALLHDMVPELIEANDLWFGHNLGGNFGLDVWDRPFDPEVGHARYDGDRYDLALIRLDRFDAVYHDALDSLLGRPVGPILRTNEAQAKRYAAHRRASLAAFSLTDDEIDLAASTQVLAHFFTPAEREALIRTWRTK